MNLVVSVDTQGWNIGIVLGWKSIFFGKPWKDTSLTLEPDVSCSCLSCHCDPLCSRLWFVLPVGGPAFLLFRPSEIACWVIPPPPAGRHYKIISSLRGFSSALNSPPNLQELLYAQRFFIFFFRKTRTENIIQAVKILSEWVSDWLYVY